MNDIVQAYGIESSSSSSSSSSAEALTGVAGLEFVVDDESRAALLMAWLVAFHSSSSSFRSPSWSSSFSLS